MSECLSLYAPSRHDFFFSAADVAGRASKGSSAERVTAQYQESTLPIPILQVRDRHLAVLTPRYSFQPVQLSLSPLVSIYSGGAHGTDRPGIGRQPSPAVARTGACDAFRASRNPCCWGSRGRKGRAIPGGGDEAGFFADCA